MTTSREAFEAKKLAQKYGIIGRVAGRYVTAGYDVDVVTTDSSAPYHFTAVKRGEKLAVRVYEKSGHVPVDIIDLLADKAKTEGYRPVLILYGAGPRITEEIISRARESGVTIRRVRG